MDSPNKHVVVTGGANGIGRCIAEAFLGAGAAVTIIDIDKAAGEALRRRFDRLCFFHGDIASTRAFQSQPDTESYSAAKGGIATLTHAMAVSLAGRVHHGGKYHYRRRDEQADGISR